MPYDRSRYYKTMAFMNVHCKIAKTAFALTVILALCIFSVSCSSAKNKQLAEQAVAQFHAQLDSEQYHAIYAGSDGRLRQASTEAEFVDLLGAIHRKLGRVQM